MKFQSPWFITLCGLSQPLHCCGWFLWNWLQQNVGSTLLPQKTRVWRLRLGQNVTTYLRTCLAKCGKVPMVPTHRSSDVRPAPLLIDHFLDQKTIWLLVSTPQKQKKTGWVKWDSHPKQDGTWKKNQRRKSVKLPIRNLCPTTGPQKTSRFPNWPAPMNGICAKADGSKSGPVVHWIAVQVTPTNTGSHWCWVFFQHPMSCVEQNCTCKNHCEMS